MTTIFGQSVQDRITERYTACRTGLEMEDAKMRDAALCQEQVSLHGQGYRRAELVRSTMGWSVRMASGLDNFELLASARYGDIDGTAEQALAWGWEWYLADSQHRALIFKGDLPHDIELALTARPKDPQIVRGHA